MRTVTDVVCPFCGTLCDDIEVDVDDAEKICSTRNACVIGDNKFMTAQASDRHLHPRIRRGGELVECTTDEAINKAAEILVNAKHPLPMGGALLRARHRRLAWRLLRVLAALSTIRPPCVTGPRFWRYTRSASQAALSERSSIVLTRCFTGGATPQTLIPAI